MLLEGGKFEFFFINLIHYEYGIIIMFFILIINKIVFDFTLFFR